MVSRRHATISGKAFVYLEALVVALVVRKKSLAQIRLFNVSSLFHLYL